MSSSGGDDACEVCDVMHLSRFFCIDCGLTYCEDCWLGARAHAPGRVNRDGMPHEKLPDKQVIDRLRDIFSPPSDPEKQRKLHEDDAGAKWFGVVRNNIGPPVVLHDYGRYSTIMRESSTGEYLERWPQLVSFVGQTGAGKSTLIKGLVDHQERIKKTGAKDDFPSPVAGSVNAHAPTSGDVHLYADPGTYHSPSPILYADCEGMDGGEQIPMGSQHKQTDEFTQSRLPAGTSSTLTRGASKNKIRSLTKAAKREIKWATDPEKCKREFAVRHMYPRMLYTFSDIIVFVLRNDRTFESAALVPLLNWAHSSIESSVNQSVKPHAIVVLNFTDPNINLDSWTVKSATFSLLSTCCNAVSENGDIKMYADFWRQRGKHISTTKDLLECYYSSTSVVRIPLKGRYGLVNDQIAELNCEIGRKCGEARETRKRLRLRFNVEEFQAALAMGFDHFSDRLYEPFDFVQLSCNLNPIPDDFGGNILRLALAMKNDPKMASKTGQDIFQHLGHMVASCIMLDYNRHHIKGSPSQLLHHYKASYSRALKEFCEDWWPCSFKFKGNRCVNTQRGHFRGHQGADGRIIDSGPYDSADGFTEQDFGDKWHAMLDNNLDHTREQMSSMIAGEIAIQEEKAAAKLHLQRMNEFYSKLSGLSTYMNHAACLCCLREFPEHPLRCGHVLCTPCVRSFARQKNRVTYAMAWCPLHKDEKWEEEWEIAIKPKLAGVRILTLDGGGVRGIVELQILAEIQRHLGKLQIATFFDLIVGTSTGGLVALGIGTKNWSVDECSRKFQDLCWTAFTPRKSWIAGFFHGAKYRTKPLELVLKESFGEDQLFGGTCEEPRYQRKVAVVSTYGTGQRAVILTNYNRARREAEPDYKFERPEHEFKELKIWEACRATSAATSYFKPFYNPRTGLDYIDGALYYNNPVRVAYQERRLLWLDVENQPPDILLSIGTTRMAEVKEKLSPGGSKTKWYRLAKNRLVSMLDAQKAWDQFQLEVRSRDESVNQRYIRLNPEVESMKNLDDVKALEALTKNVDACFKSPKWHTDTRAVARRLIASSFFFEKDPKSTSDSHIQGWMCCRFPDESEELRLLGYHLRKLQSAQFQPHFLITEEFHENASSVSIIYKEVIAAMTTEATFDIEKLTIYLSSPMAATSISLCFSEDEAFPISGFPRQLGPKVLRANTRTQRSVDVLDATKKSQFQAAKQTTSSPSNLSKSHSSSADPVTPRSINVKSQTAEKATTPPQTPIEDVPFWARGGAAHHVSSKPMKNLRDIMDTPISKSGSYSESGSDSRSVSSVRSPFSHTTASQSTNHIGEHDIRLSPGTYEEASQIDIYPGALPEDYNANFSSNKLTSREEQTRSNDWRQSTTSRAMGHARDASPTPTRPARDRRIHCHSRSLQDPPFYPKIFLQSQPPMSHVATQDALGHRRLAPSQVMDSSAQLVQRSMLETGIDGMTVRPMLVAAVGDGMANSHPAETKPRLPLPIKIPSNAQFGFRAGSAPKARLPMEFASTSIFGDPSAQSIHAQASPTSYHGISGQHPGGVIQSKDFPMMATVADPASLPVLMGVTEEELVQIAKMRSMKTC